MYDEQPDTIDEATANATDDKSYLKHAVKLYSDCISSFDYKAAQRIAESVNSVNGIKYNDSIRRK
jgi:hypothetical protein